MCPLFKKKTLENVLKHFHLFELGMRSSVVDIVCKSRTCSVFGKNEIPQTAEFAKSPPIPF